MFNIIITFKKTVMNGKILSLIAAVFFILASTQTFAQEKTILCFGNSLTAGYGLAKEEAWPMLIQEKISQAELNYKVIQSGLSGETSAGGLSRIKWVLKDPIDVFILELGPNDGLRGLPLSQTEKNLQQIIDYVKSKNPEVKIILAGMRVPPNMGPEYSNEFQTLFEKLASKNKARLIPFFLEGVAGNKELNLDDGIHPNKEGQKIVANTVWKYLKPIL
ncbi:MAG: arylesterase [Cytophagales bacterium]